MGAGRDAEGSRVFSRGWYGGWNGVREGMISGDVDLVRVREGRVAAMESLNNLVECRGQVRQRDQEF